MVRQDSFHGEGAWLGAAITAARGNGVIFRHLAGVAAGRMQEALLGLYRETRHTAAVLQGIRVLRGDAPVTHVPAPELHREPTALLSEALTVSRRLHREFFTRTGDPDFGLVYHQLAENKARELRELLALIGQFTEK